MIRLIDVVAVKYAKNDCFDEIERNIFSELRRMAANIYLSTKFLKFDSILDAVICANRFYMPQLVERIEKDINYKLIRYTPSDYSITILPENYFKKEKVNA